MHEDEKDAFTGKDIELGWCKSMLALPQSRALA
jgi:hypothetical protein